MSGKILDESVVKKTNESKRLEAYLELPLNHERIRNETELREAFLNLLEQGFGYNRYEFMREGYLKQQKGSSGFYQTRAVSQRSVGISAGAAGRSVHLQTEIAA